MRLAAFLVLSAVAVCVHAGDVARHGQPVPAGETIAVSAALSDFDTYAGTPRRFSGRITEVCQARGCWMMLEDDGQAARVMFGKHDFFIDKDTTGTAVVHGVLERKELTPEQVDHFTGDSASGRQAASVEYRIVADGIEITS